jgi:hypothetical protein
VRRSSGLGTQSQPAAYCRWARQGLGFSQLAPAVAQYCDHVLLIGEAAEAMAAALGMHCPTVDGAGTSTAVAAPRGAPIRGSYGAAVTGLRQL